MQGLIFGAAAAAVEGPDYSSGREALDRYYTPPWFIDLLLDELKLEPGTALEPFAGRALALAGRLCDRGHYVETADLDGAAPVLWHGDSMARQWSSYQTIITNPPYSTPEHALSSIAQRFEPLALVFGALLRLSFLEPCDDRGAWLEHNPPNLLMVMPRFSFTGAGSDNVTTAWFVWDKRREALQRGQRIKIVSKAAAAAAHDRFKIEAYHRMNQGDQSPWIK